MKNCFINLSGEARAEMEQIAHSAGTWVLLQRLIGNCLDAIHPIEQSQRVYDVKDRERYRELDDLNEKAADIILSLCMLLEDGILDRNTIQAIVENKCKAIYNDMLENNVLHR